MINNYLHSKGIYPKLVEKNDLHQLYISKEAYWTTIYFSDHDSKLKIISFAMILFCLFPNNIEIKALIVAGHSGFGIIRNQKYRMESKGYIIRACRRLLIQLSVLSISIYDHLMT